MKENGKKKYQKKLQLTLKVFLLIVCIMIIILLPDILFGLRLVIKKTPGIKSAVCVNISDKEYIQMMIVALINCIAVSISFMAYCVAKTTGKVQIESYEQEIIYRAYKMEKNIKKNCHLIFDLKNNIGNISELKAGDEVLKYGFFLFSAKRITPEEKEIWQVYVEKVSWIIKYYEDSKDAIMYQKIDEFCKKFFEEDSETMEYNQEMRSLLDKLKKILEGE